MSDGGKGSSPRPYSIDQETMRQNWERTFKKQDNTDTSKNEYYDILQTEDALVDSNVIKGYN
jgi:hypothetical protein